MKVRSSDGGRELSRLLHDVQQASECRGFSGQGSVTCRRGSVLSVDALGATILGCAPAELIGIAITDLFHSLPSSIDSQSLNEEPPRLHIVRRTAHGAEQYLLCAVCRNGSDGYTVTFSDISSYYTLRRLTKRLTEECWRLQEDVERKNESLKEVLWQVEDTRQQIGFEIQESIEKIAVPILAALREQADKNYRRMIDIAVSTLFSITGTVVSKLTEALLCMTPRELQICHMISNGFSSKDIALFFNTSVQTVITQRKVIRRKLGLTHEQINLANYLRKLFKQSDK